MGPGLGGLAEAADDLKPKIGDLESSYKELLQFQTNAVIDAGTPPSRICATYPHTTPAL